MPGLDERLLCSSPDARVEEDLHFTVGVSRGSMRSCATSLCAYARQA
jgi:hypothetical protein